jgi:tetratricopeptide (TPR) repeat protein
MLLILPFLAALAGAPLGAPAAGLEASLSAARSDVRQHPNSARALDRLAALELRLYRLNHAAETLQAAEAAIERALELDPQDFDARRFKASTLLTRHRFAEAEKEAIALSTERPRDADVLGMVADARMETGQYDEALEAIQKMVDLRPGLPSYSRVSYAREIHGDLAGALAVMDLAVRAGNPEDPEATSWCLARSGLLAWKLGRIDDAEQRFRGALTLFPNSPYALEGLGLVSTARGDFGRAAENFERAFAIVPWPQFAVELSELARRRGRRVETERWESVVRALEQLSSADGLFNRVLALFEADHGSPTRAVEMACGELALRKDVYGYDACAWAQYRAGKTTEAADTEKHAIALGTEDPVLDFHAGMIFGASGQEELGIRHLEKAIRVNPNFHVLYAGEAEAELRAVASRGRS